MNVHETDEDLSAYLDEELAPEDRARVHAHLQVCDECSSRSAVLHRTMRAMAALPDVAPTPDESRAIRLKVIEARARPRAWRFMAAMAGATAVIVAVATGAFLLRPQQKQTASDMTESSAGSAADTTELVFADTDEVTASVSSLSEVESGKGRYKVSDVGTEQSKALEAYSDESPTVAEQSETAGSQRQGQPAGGSTAGVPLGECLRTTLRSQPYPMMPLAARSALYKGTPSWLLVFAWTRSTDDNARLDRIQIWLFDRRAAACSADNFLYYYAS